MGWSRGGQWVLPAGIRRGTQQDAAGSIFGRFTPHSRALLSSGGFLYWRSGSLLGGILLLMEHLAMLRDSCYDKPRLHIKEQRYHTANKGPQSQSYGFSSSHVCTWELDHKESQELKNCWFQIVVLEKTLEIPLDSKEIKPVNPKRNQPWIFFGRTDAEAEAEAPILWPPVAKSWFTRKDPGAGKDWGQEEKRFTEDKMVGWYQQLNGHEVEQIPGDSRGQTILACRSSWGHKESDTTEWLNNKRLPNVPTRRRWDGIQWVEARGTDEHPMMSSRSPCNKQPSAPYISSPPVEKLCAGV